MCNRYAQRGSMSQIRQLSLEFGMDLTTTSATDNLPPMEDIKMGGDIDAPVIRATGNGKSELVMMRWGIQPSYKPKDEEKGREAGFYEEKTNNIKSEKLLQKNSMWRIAHAYPRDFVTDPTYRCLIPVTEFAEPAWKSTWYKMPAVEVFFVAGLWRSHHCGRLVPNPDPTKKRRVREERDWDLYDMITTPANDVVAPVHERMPAILHKPEDCASWLSGSEESLALLQPLADSDLVIDRVDTK